MQKQNYRNINLPELSKQVRSEDIFNLFVDRYAEIIPQWMPLQVE